VYPTSCSTSPPEGAKEFIRREDRYFGRLEILYITRDEYLASGANSRQILESILKIAESGRQSKMDVTIGKVYRCYKTFEKADLVPNFRSR